LTLRSLERRADQLRAAFHQQTPEGRREWNALCNRSMAAVSDKAFQTFKAIFIPEPKKPGRKPKIRSGGAAT
jgi:hypothetical protein